MAKEKIKNSIFLNFSTEVVKDKRYWLLLVMFLIFLFLGQNIPPNDEVDKTLRNIGTPEIESNALIYESRDIINSKPGENYHILFQVKVSNFQNNEQFSEEIRLSLTDNLGNHVVISNLIIQANSDQFTSEDLVFPTDKKYKNLLFEKIDSGSQSTVFIKNIHIVRLEGNNKIKPSFIGDFNHSKPEELFSYKEATSVLAEASSRHKKVGEIFIANSDYLMGIKMKLHFRGNGGNGDYQIAISRVDDGKVADQKIAELNFNSSIARAIYKVDDLNEIYLFPISAKLSPGQKYFIELNSRNVKTNFFNNLQIFGKNSLANLNIGVKGHDGSFYIRYYFAKEKTYNNQKFNFGDKFDDLGNGTGEYSYNLSSAYSNLDIFESGEDFFTYKIGTFYPFKTLHLEASFAVPESDSCLSYSFNNTDWFPIEKLKMISTNKYQKQIQGDGKMQTIYVRSTGQALDRTTFNLNDFTVSASVIISD